MALFLVGVLETSYLVEINSFTYVTDTPVFRQKGHMGQLNCRTVDTFVHFMVHSIHLCSELLN